MDGKILTRYGIDYEKGLQRCTQDAAFYEMLLTMFLEDSSFARAKAAYEDMNRRKLFECLHELKGVSGNTAMTELYEAVCPLVELVRNGAADEAEITRLFTLVEDAYTRAREGISLALGEG